MLKKLKQKILAIFRKNSYRSKKETVIGEVYYED